MKEIAQEFGARVIDFFSVDDFAAARNAVLARNGDGGQTVVDHIRLFPLREDACRTYRVHEQIQSASALARDR